MLPGSNMPKMNEYERYARVENDLVEIDDLTGVLTPLGKRVLDDLLKTFDRQDLEDFYSRADHRAQSYINRKIGYAPIRHR